MTKPGYKMTDIGEIPEGWKIDKVSNLKESMYYGITAKSTEQSSHLRFLRTTDISNFNFDPNDLHYCEITGTKPDLSKYYLKQGDIIVARAGTVGVSVLVKRDLPNTIFGSYLIKIAFNKDLIYANFVHYYFQSDIYWNKLRAAQGSTIKNISLPFLKALLIPVPPLQEQQKIAEVLSTADETIQKVNEEITLTEKLKKGLMQTLLTKGIGHTKFKMTQIGEIPDGWNVKELYQVSEPRKEMIEPMKYMSEHYVGLENISPGQLRIFSYGDATDLKSSKFKFKKGDILYGKLRPYLDKVALAETDGVCSTDIIPIVSRNVNARFLAYMLHSDLFLQFVKSTISGTNHPRTAWKQMSLFLVPFPSISEQQKIAEILTTVDRKLELLRNKRAHLEELKKGMMEDLLTGRVRVKV